MSNSQDKKLSWLLRHKPMAAGLTLDSAGWTSVEILLKNLGWSKPYLDNIVSLDDKGRFEYNSDQTMIRASQGHSVKVDLGYQESQPPEYLFHGTARKFFNSIVEKGLVKGSRHHVHLSDNYDTAQSVGARHGDPIVLKVLSKSMFDDGFKFYLSTNGVWLTDHVQLKYLLIVPGQF